MHRPRVYVETTIPSFYFDERCDPKIVAQRQSTREWWQRAVTRWELVTSVAVWSEILRGPEHRQGQWIGLLRDLTLLALEPRIRATEATYIAQKVMPARLDGDALHLAFASHYKCDYLVTWDFRHLANANKFQHIRRVNAKLGLFVPQIVTPRELMEVEDDRED
ncbi:MAG TPA: PIN domain-containing protein [Longimicrobiaceae bacterium]